MNVQASVFLLILLYPLLIRISFALVYIFIKGHSKTYFSNLRYSALKSLPKCIYLSISIISILCLIVLPDLNYIINFPEYWKCFILSLGASSVLGVLLGIFCYFFIKNILIEDKNYLVNPRTNLNTIIFLCIIMIFEEIIWRGFSFYYLNSNIGLTTYNSILISSLMFGTWHIKEKNLNKTSFIRFSIHSFTGMAFCLTFVYFNSIIFSYITHLFYNFTILILTKNNIKIETNHA